MRNLELQLSPTVRYRRMLPGANFSLEANTAATPKQDRFYLIKDGDIVFDSRDFQKAVEAYHDLCREYWKGQLESSDLEHRMASAWGLLSLDPTHEAAARVVRDDGDASAKRRLEALRRRRWAQNRAAARRKKS